MKLGELVRKYRQDHSLTVREFAVKSGVSHGYIAMLENGKNSKTGLPITPGLVTLKKIATGMNLTIDELMLTVDDMPVTIQTGPSISESQLTPQERSLLDIFRLIPEEQQKVFLEMGRVYANSLKKD